MWTLLTLRIVLSGEDVFEKDLSKSPTLGRGKRAHDHCKGEIQDIQTIQACHVEQKHDKACKIIQDLDKIFSFAYEV